MTTNPDRRASPIRRTAPPRIPHWLRFVLEVPLEMKLLGANLIIVAVAGLLLFGPVELQPARLTNAYIVVVALILGATVNLVLVRLALGPIESLERVARWVSEGRLAARVPRRSWPTTSWHGSRRPSTRCWTISLPAASEWEGCGAEVIYAEERERSQVAQELHDSVGQKLADASFEIAASTNEMKSDARDARLAKARALLRAAIEEIRNISSSSHLHVVTDLDLPKALDTLRGATPRHSLSNARSTVDRPEGSVPDRRAAAMSLNIREMQPPSANARQS